MNQSSVKAKDENRLAELGYEQELTRNWSLIHNFGVSFSIIVSTYTALGILFSSDVRFSACRLRNFVISSRMKNVIYMKVKQRVYSVPSYEWTD